jgi:hypothetical protein
MEILVHAKTKFGTYIVNEGNCNPLIKSMAEEHGHYEIMTGRSTRSKFNGELSRCTAAPLEEYCTCLESAPMS